MKNKFVIIVLTVLTLLMSVFAYIQKLEADKNRIEAEKQSQIAKANLIRAMELEQALMKCNSEKK